MKIPGARIETPQKPVRYTRVHVETLENPVRYTHGQIETACAVAQILNRGKLVLVESPSR
jgi:hypothetical protein